MAVQHRLDDAAEEPRRAVFAQRPEAGPQQLQQAAPAAQLLDQEDVLLRLVHVLQGGVISQRESTKKDIA